MNNKRFRPLFNNNNFVTNKKILPKNIKFKFCLKKAKEIRKCLAKLCKFKFFCVDFSFILKTLSIQH